jgi:hypothetical protein
MLAGMKLDVFTPLKDGPLNAEQVASKLGVNAGKLGPLMYALVIAGLLTEEDGTFSNTPETDQFLVRGKASYMGDTHKIWYSNLQASLKTAETIQTGVPQTKYDWSNMAEDELKALYEGMSAHDAVFANWLSAQYDFSQCQRLLDAGGGVEPGLSVPELFAKPSLHYLGSLFSIDYPILGLFALKFINSLLFLFSLHQDCTKVFFKVREGGSVVIPPYDNYSTVLE